MHVRARRIVSRLTYANVMSTFAVFLVVGGGAAYAANTVFSTDIVNGEVKTPDLATDAVNSAKILNNSVYPADVRDDTLTNGGLTSADLAFDSVTASELAPNSVSLFDLQDGAVQSDSIGLGALPAHIYIRQASTTVNTTATKELTVACDFAGDSVLGGGFVIAGTSGVNVPEVAIQRSYAVNSQTWLVRAVATSGTPNWQITAVATCVR